jgi:hypothetical protein
MAHGLPVMITSVGISVDLLDKSVPTPVDNLGAYAECLAKLVNDPARLTAFSKRNRHLAGGFKRSKLLARRRQFFNQAIDMSRR